ncbi:MAG: undecaprenyldiphospho-muramoylpentapeptide beta-N-acetylglucosaminyltransferase [Candidatus Carbobacillus altaicus]|nr:undecaprenyldiphospho-muramoylpentapeptide beta-N-acetylglucosaminyltransferase [Candidatus Carbobacillus altaicus]
MRIVFTGGGTAGHVMVNLALIPHLLRDGHDVFYIGSEKGIERRLVEATFPQVPYTAIASGKLRRYWTLENVREPGRVIKGLFDAHRSLRRFKPDLVFSKGGYVAVPVIWAARLLGIPAIIHESDFTPGLANRLSAPFASDIIVTFAETKTAFPEHKVHYFGAIVRPEIFQGRREKGFEICRFHPRKPVLLIVGGSLGARRINSALRQALNDFLAHFQLIHLTGEGNLAPELERPGYCQLAFAREEMPDLLAAADLVISRAGANTIFELLYMQKPMLLVPLSLAQSRGDQLKNAASFERQGFAHVLSDEALAGEDGGRRLLDATLKLYEARHTVLESQQPYGEQKAVEALSSVLQLITARAHKRK